MAVKSTIVARRRNGDGEGKSVDLHARIVADETDLLLFSGWGKKERKKGKEKHKTLGIKGCKTVQLRATPLLSAAAAAPDVRCNPGTASAAPRRGFKRSPLTAGNKA